MRSSVDLKSEAELRSMTFQQLDERLAAVAETLSIMRQWKKKGYGNPKVFKAVKREKKLILSIKRERKNQIRKQEKNRR